MLYTVGNEVGLMGLVGVVHRHDVRDRRERQIPVVVGEGLYARRHLDREAGMPNIR